MSTIKTTNLQHPSAASPNLTLAADGSITGGSGLGKILQVVQTVKTDRFTTTSGTAVDITGFSATITPTATTSKILVMSSFHYSGASSGSYSYPRLQLVRDSTTLTVGNSSGSASQVTASGQVLSNDQTLDVHNIGFNYLDSPATTSSTTYKWQAYTFSGRLMTFNGTSTTTDSNRLNTSSSLILMEVAA